MATGVVLSPRPVARAVESVRASKPDLAVALRADSLAGLTVGIRRDQHWRSWDWITDRWAETLRARGADVVLWRAASQVGKEAEEVRQQLDEFIGSVDVAIFGLANCGGCTMETVRDAQLSTERGVPTVVVSTEQFQNLARQLASRSGWSEAPVEVLPFPLETRPRHEVDEVADEHLVTMLELLADAS